VATESTSSPLGGGAASPRFLLGRERMIGRAERERANWGWRTLVRQCDRSEIGGEAPPHGRGAPPHRIEARGEAPPHGIEAQGEAPLHELDLRGEASAIASSRAAAVPAAR
jgi:hypothetical protein